MRLVYYKLKLFAMSVEDHVKSSILAAVKSIQNHTCIKFKETHLAPSNILRAQKFTVVFSNLGKRYLLSNNA